MKKTEPGYRDHTFWRSDFKNTADGGSDNFFDSLLASLGIYEGEAEQINCLDVRISHCEATG